MKRYVWELGDNGGEKWTIYVRATENEIYDRLYTGGFQRFNGAIYGYSNEYPRGTKINGKKIIVKEDRQEIKNLVKSYKRDIMIN